jgi:hypothetical protein
VQEIDEIIGRLRDECQLTIIDVEQNINLNSGRRKPALPGPLV